jgi:hypothetical protein
MKKNILKITSALVLGVFASTSCKTVSPRKLDGNWTVTSGSGSFTHTENGDTYSYTQSYNGSAMTYSFNGDVEIDDMTISYTFDKKAGTYTRTETGKNTTSEQFNYYIKTPAYNGFPATYDGNNYYDRKDVSEYTEIEKGTFTITGGTGDIEKNSQIVFLPTSTSKETKHTFSYFDQNNDIVNDLSNSWKPIYNNGNQTTYELLPTKSTNLKSDDGKSISGTIMTVTSLKKGIMEVTLNTSNTHKEGASEYTETDNMKYTLTQK